MTATLETKLKFTGIQHDQLRETWPYVRRLVEKGLALENGFYSPYDILQLLDEKKMQLWVAIDPIGKQIVAVCVTQLAIYPKGKACWVVLVGGSFLDHLLPFIHILKMWAKESGCDRILSYSRDGWLKKAAPYGFKKLRTLIGCSLEDDNENLQ